MTGHARLFVLGLVVTAGLFAQRSAHRGASIQPQRGANFMSPYRAMPAPPNAHRFGNILFPGGTTTASPVVRGPIWPFGTRPSTGHGHNSGPRRGRTVVVPYAVPVFAGGFGYYDYPAPQQPVTVVVPEAPPPTVIINNHFGEEEGVKSTVSTLRDGEEEPVASRQLKVYEAPTPKKPAPEAAATKAAPVDERPSIYVLVGRDGAAREAIGYWVRDGRLHYVTANAQIRQVALDELDLEASERVNAQRNVPFDLRRLLN